VAVSEDTKRCPDCAETILAAARKCRFCGYRFDRTTGNEVLGGLFRRSEPERTLEQLVEDWGEELDPGEQSVSMTFSSRDKVDGYLLVTNRRVAFFGPPPDDKRTGVVGGLLRRAEQAKLAELPLDELVSIEVTRWPRRLILHGHIETLEIGGLSGAQARGLRDQIGAAAAVEGA
jgi:hypothetical protein